MLELFIFILGVCIGSFMNVLILRIPVNKSIVLPRSSCPHCKSPLKAYHLIPILSFIFLQGKCASCKHNISLQYPLIELLSGAIFIFIFFKLGLSLASLCVALCFVLLLALSVIDFYHKAVPDNLNLAALLFALFSAPLYFTFEHALLFAGGFTLLRFSLSFLLKKRSSWRRRHHRFWHYWCFTWNTIRACYYLSLSCFCYYCIFNCTSKEHATTIHTFF